MIKVICRDGSWLTFDCNNFSHNKDHKMFFVDFTENRVMIPEDVVAVIGTIDEVTQEFV